MKKYFVSALLGLAATMAFAQTAMPRDQLYKALGEKPGLVKLMDRFMTGLVADPRTGPFFKPVDQNHVKEQLVEQISQVAGGPCEYQGKDMKTAHMDMHVTKADFNALVEVLQDSMSAEGIAFSTQNQLLSRLAPLHRAVVSTDK
jgi:hemoglobin